MAVRIYTDNPSGKEISNIVEILKSGGVIIYPTDTLYALGCDIDNEKAVRRVCQIKKLDPEKAPLTIICDNISQISEFATVSDSTFTLLKECLPGPFTFILNGRKELPKMLKKRKQVGVRIPDNPIALAIVKELGHPILSSSIFINEDEMEYCTNPELIEETYNQSVDCVIDGGEGGVEPSTIIDCTGETPVEKRKGKGTLIS